WRRSGRSARTRCPRSSSARRTRRSRRSSTSSSRRSRRARSTRTRKWRGSVSEMTDRDGLREGGLPHDGLGQDGGGRAPALVLRGIGKSYGPVVACDAVDLTVHRGEIHGLLGENGAGKSTLMKILLGLVRRDTGTIHHDGRPVEVTGPQEAIALGIGMVHQHFSLVEPLTVWENVTLGDTGKVDRA